jgi:hypothetical protein
MLGPWEKREKREVPEAARTTKSVIDFQSVDARWQKAI